MIVGRTLGNQTLMSECAYVKYSSRLKLEDVWALHQQRVRGLEAQGKQVEQPETFNQCAELLRLEDSGSTCAPPWRPTRNRKEA